MRGFEESPEGSPSAAIAVLDTEERAVVARVVADVGLLAWWRAVRHGASTSSMSTKTHCFGTSADLKAPSAIPTIRRCCASLPNAAPDDRDVADEFRRFTEPELRTLKVDRLRAIWKALNEDGPEWIVPAADAMSTAAALTDVRLVLASRLGMETDDDAAALHAEIDRAHDPLDGTLRGRYRASTPRGCGLACCTRR